jgi:prevent-host-death family protein
MKSKNFVGVTWLKIATAQHLRDLDEPVIVCCHSQPVAAVVPYDLYLKWQEQLEKSEGLQN